MSSPSISVDLPVCDPDNVTLLKLVQASILVSLILKTWFFLAIDQVHQAFPMTVPFFPAWLTLLVMLRISWMMASATALLAIFAKEPRSIFLVTLINFFMLCVLSIHQYSYNDVTFMCCAWASLWCLWMSTRLSDPFESLFPRAAWLAHLILSMIFIGGAAGKLTDGYWNGQVLYEIYFVDRDFWTYNLVRSIFPEDSLPTVAMWHSRMVVCAEWVCGFLWLMPQRLASVVAIVMLCGIALTNNFLLFSVVTSLLGLAIIGLHQKKDKSVRLFNPFETDDDAT